jgi:predicted N-acetyltransferase YhbS
MTPPPAPLLIRRAASSEQRALEALQLRAALMNAGDRAALLANPGIVELPIAQIQSGNVFVAERDGVILGFVVVLPRDDGEAELDGLFVEPSAWRGGIGRALVEVGCAFAQTLGASLLHVVGNHHAAAFYKSCGFEPVGETQTQFGPAPLLRKRLSP